MSVLADEMRVRVEASDDEPGGPAPLSPSVDAESGRGMMIIDALASAWGVLESAAGKSVWFVRPAPP